MHLRHLRRVKPTVIFDLKKYYGTAWKRLREHTDTTIVSWMRQNLEPGKQQRLYRADPDVDIFSKMHVAVSCSLVDEKLFPLIDYDREDLFLQFIKFHINGVATDRGRETFHKLLDQGL